MRKPTPAQIKRQYNEAGSGHFFDRDSMRFFGDRMSSFRTVAIGDAVYMYRRPDATVRTFRGERTAGRDFFGAWKWDAETCNLSSCGNDETQAVYDAI